MKKNTIIIIVILFVSSFFYFACEDAGDGEAMSIQERVENFEYDLNTDVDTINPRNHIYNNFHPDMPQYNTWKDGMQWESSQFASSNAPFTFSSIDYTNNPVTGICNFNSTDYTISITLAEDNDVEDNWLIMSVSLNGLQIIPTP